MTPASLLRGDRAATLHLVWSLALHLETRAALAASTLPDTLGSPNTEVGTGDCLKPGYCNETLLT